MDYNLLREHETAKSCIHAQLGIRQSIVVKAVCTLIIFRL